MFSSANTLVQPCLLLILIPQVRDWAKDSIPVHLFQELTTSESRLLTLEIPDNPYTDTSQFARDATSRKHGNIRRTGKGKVCVFMCVSNCEYVCITAHAHMYIFPWGRDSQSNAELTNMINLDSLLALGTRSICFPNLKLQVAHTQQGFTWTLGTWTLVLVIPQQTL